MDGATNNARPVAYTFPVGPSVTVDFIQSLRPSTLSTSAVQRIVAPELIFYKQQRAGLSDQCIYCCCFVVTYVKSNLTL